METIKVYQELTFEVLDKLIREECKKGNSRLNLKGHSMSYNMLKFLENKGFNYSEGRYSKHLSW